MLRLERHVSDTRAWMTLEDFAEKIGRSRRQVVRYVRDGIVKADQLVDGSGRPRFMIRAAELLRFEPEFEEDLFSYST